MRIALVTDAWLPQVNGVVTTLGHVVRQLEAMGDEVLVINPQSFHTYPMPRYPEIRLAWFPGRKVRRLLREFDPDAIHIATEGPLGMAARLHCGRRRIAFNTSYHTQFPQYLEKYAWIPAGWTYRVMRWFHGRANATLVPTANVKHELDERGFTNVLVWTRGVQTDLFKPGDKSFLPGERPICLYVGRVATEKNIEAFLEADVPGTKYIVGDGPARASLERKYPDAHFVGVKKGEDLAKHYAAADVFVFPSRTDTFGVVMLEAMACGVPVAAYPVTGPIDVVSPGVSGALDEDLSAAIRAALKIDPQSCRDYAQGFSWKRCAEIFREALRPTARDANSRDANSRHANSRRANSRRANTF